MFFIYFHACFALTRGMSVYRVIVGLVVTPLLGFY
jgi:hypothetical protein